MQKNNIGIGRIRYSKGKNLSETRGSLRGIGEVVFEGKRYFVKSKGDGSQPGPQPYPPIEKDTFRVKLDPDGYWSRENPNAQMTCIDEANNVWDVKLLLPRSKSIFYYYQGTEIEILECGDFENVKSFTFHEGITYNVAGYSVKFTAEPNWAKLETAEDLFGGLQNKSFDINFEYNPDVPNYSCRGMFLNCTKMEYAPEIVTLASQDLSNMFFNCMALKEIPEWLGDRMEEMGPYMPYGINLTAMFWSCSSLKTIPLNFIEALYYASSVNTTFMNCSCMESNILAAYNKLAKYNTEHDKDTFNYCGIDTESGRAELEQIPESWGGKSSGIGPNTLRFAFSDESTDPTTLDMYQGTWTRVENHPDYNNVWDWTYDDSDWSYTFSNKLEYWFDPDIKIIASNTGNVTNMNGMFNECNTLTSVHLLDTSNATTMEYMFYGCTSLTTVPLLDTSNVYSMHCMFSNCSSLTTVPLFDTSNVTTMEYMFYGCGSLTNVPLFNTNNTVDMSNMFVECINIESGMLDLYQQASSGGNVTSYYNCFLNAGVSTGPGMTEREQIPVDWGGDLY